MDLEPFVHRAQTGDVKAFVELTRGYQHLAFRSALALVHDLHQDEDVVQEAFLAAWSALREGYSEGTVGAVQTFFLRGQEEPWTVERLKDFAAADVVIHLARDVAKAKIYPAVDLRNSRSRLLETAAVGEKHRAVAAQVRRVLAAALWNTGDRPDAAIG